MSRITSPITSRLPKSWKSHVTSSYPEGFIVPNRIECYKPGKSARFVYTYWDGKVVYNVVGTVTKKEEAQLKAYCDERLNLPI